MNSTAKSLALITGLAAITMTSLIAKSSHSSQGKPFGHHRRGTDILHLFLKTSMNNEGVETNASGKVDASQNQQGNANVQRLEISLKGLTTNATYRLTALLDDDTNQTDVAEFTTDSDGKAKLRYHSMMNNKNKQHGGNGNGNGNGNGHGKGKGKGPLPAALDPISDVRELSVFNSSTQAVLTADLTDPDKFIYLVKRDLGTTNVDATLRIFASTRKAHFHLTASGLEPAADYLLVLNGEVVETNTSGTNGVLKVSSSIEPPSDILDLHSLALWDTFSNVVVSTELP